MEKIVAQQAEVEEEEDSVVVEVVVMEEAEEGMIGTSSSMNKVTQKMAFNVIIVSATGI